MKWAVLFFIATSCVLLTSGLCMRDNVMQQSTLERHELLSEINGYKAWESEMRLYGANDVDAFIRGVRAKAAGLAPPQQMSPEEMQVLADEAEFESHKKSIDKNLQASVEFLAEVAQKPGIICLVDKMLYYEVLNQGTGEGLVDGTTPHLFNYTVSVLDVKEIFDSQGNGRPQKICLDCVIPGFAQGVIGMKLAERRKLYIHPNLAFRTMHWTLPPNAALVMDVQLEGLGV